MTAAPRAHSMKPNRAISMGTSGTACIASSHWRCSRSRGRSNSTLVTWVAVEVRVLLALGAGDELAAVAGDQGGSR